MKRDSKGRFVSESNVKDIIGQKFGRLFVLGRGRKDRRGEVFWNCVCDCGNETFVRINHLKSGATRSCGCLRRETVSENLIDRKFGRLFVLEEAGKDRRDEIFWRCLCDCGNETTVRSNSLKAGNTKSCGCLQKEIASETIKGERHPNWKGGISCEPYCDVWLDKEFKKSIKQRDSYRCMNPDCWKTVKRLSIHHIDYNKKNCNPNNLITLCTSCNSRANFDREWHKSWYQAIMYRRYG